MPKTATVRFQGWNITLTEDAEGNWSWTAVRKKQTASKNPGSPVLPDRYKALEDAKAQLGKGKV